MKLKRMNTYVYTAIGIIESLAGTHREHTMHSGFRFQNFQNLEILVVLKIYKTQENKNNDRGFVRNLIIERNLVLDPKFSKLFFYLT